MVDEKKTTVSKPMNNYVFTWVINLNKEISYSILQQKKFLFVSMKTCSRMLSVN